MRAWKRVRTLGVGHVTARPQEFLRWPLGEFQYRHKRQREKLTPSHKSDSAPFQCTAIKHLCEGVSLDLAFTQVFNARIRITCKNSVNCICIKNRIHCTYKTYIFTQRHKNISKSDNVVKYKFCYYICSIKMLILLNLTTHMLTVIRTRAHNWVAQAPRACGVLPWDCASIWRQWSTEENGVGLYCR